MTIFLDITEILSFEGLEPHQGLEFVKETFRLLVIDRDNQLIKILDILDGLEALWEYVTLSKERARIWSFAIPVKMGRNRR